MGPENQIGGESEEEWMLTSGRMKDGEWSGEEKKKG
jgi:hypothetical protein